MENIKLTNLLNNNGQIEGLPKNPRLIKDERFEKLKKSIQDDPEMLQLRELLVYPYNDKFIVIGGNMRLKAMKELGYKEAPCKVIDASTPPEKLRAYTIKDNVGYGEHDIDLLANDWDVEELKDWGVEDIDFEIENIEPEETEGDDDIPESAPAITVKGDLYELGEHRLLCGDSTLVDDVEKLMDGEKADMVFTDPPYNINFKPQRGTHDIIKNDNMVEEDFEEFLNDVFVICKTILKENTYLISFMGWSTIPNFKKALESSFDIKSMPIWVKNNFGIGYYTRPKYEPFYLCLNGNPDKPSNPPADVFEFQKVHNTIHSCEKPVGLILEIMQHFNKNGIIYEPFCGSGSTLIACEKTNRKCYGMELDEKYVDVIVKRYIDFCKKNDRPVSVKRNGEDCLKDFESNIE